MLTPHPGAPCSNRILHGLSSPVDLPSQLCCPTRDIPRVSFYQGNMSRSSLWRVLLRESIFLWIQRDIKLNNLRLSAGNRMDLRKWLRLWPVLASPPLTCDTLTSSVRIFLFPEHILFTDHVYPSNQCINNSAPS